MGMATMCGLEGIVFNWLVPHLQRVASHILALHSLDYSFLCCTVWRVHCAQPGLYEAQQRSNKSSPLLPFLHVTSIT